MGERVINGNNLNSFLVAKSNSFHSPPFLTLMAGAAISATLPEIKERIGRWLNKRKEYRELCECLFGFTRSCEFITGIRTESSSSMNSPSKAAMRAFVDFIEVIPFERATEVKRWMKCLRQEWLKTSAILEQVLIMNCWDLWKGMYLALKNWKEVLCPLCRTK